MSFSDFFSCSKEQCVKDRERIDDLKNKMETANKSFNTAIRELDRVSDEYRKYVLKVGEFKKEHADCVKSKKNCECAANSQRCCYTGDKQTNCDCTLNSYMYQENLRLVKENHELKKERDEIHDQYDRYFKRHSPCDGPNDSDLKQAYENLWIELIAAKAALLVIKEKRDE